MAINRRWFVLVVLILFSGFMTLRFAASQAEITESANQTKDRARVVLSKKLPKLEGKHLKVTLVEVNYGPGEASPPHSHPCAVLGYVVDGHLRMQIRGEREITYRAGESFYEAPNGVHLVSANASSTEPAKLLAYLICDHDAPLSVDMSEGPHQKGHAQ